MTQSDGFAFPEIAGDLPTGYRIEIEEMHAVSTVPDLRKNEISSSALKITVYESNFPCFHVYVVRFTKSNHPDVQNVSNHCMFLEHFETLQALRISCTDSVYGYGVFLMLDVVRVERGVSITTTYQQTVTLLTKNQLTH